MSEQFWHVGDQVIPFDAVDYDCMGIVVHVDYDPDGEIENITVQFPTGILRTYRSFDIRAMLEIPGFNQPI